MPTDNSNSPTFNVTGWAEIGLSASVQATDYDEAAELGAEALREELIERIEENGADALRIDVTHTEMGDQ